MQYIWEYTLSDLERAIAGLGHFDRRCPSNIRLVGHFGVANICSYWLVIFLCFLSFLKTLHDFKFHRNDNIKQRVFLSLKHGEIKIC